MQGRDGGGLPTFFRGAGGHGGLRKRRVAPARCALEGEERGAFWGHGEGAELCLGTAGSLGLPLSCISPCRLQLWRERPAVLLPLPSAGWGRRKAGSTEPCQHPAARHRLAPLKGCARKSGARQCQRALGRSRGRRHPQTFFSPLHPVQTSPTPMGLSLGASTSWGTHLAWCSETAWGASHPQHLHPQVHPAGPGGMGCFWGLLAYP